VPLFDCFVDCLVGRHRQAGVGEFVVACPETFGTTCPRADKQWHKGKESVDVPEGKNYFGVF
jgi:hypothetical protein